MCTSASASAWLSSHLFILRPGYLLRYTKHILLQASSYLMITWCEVYFPGGRFIPYGLYLTRGQFIPYGTRSMFHCRPFYSLWYGLYLCKCVGPSGIYGITQVCVGAYQIVVLGLVGRLHRKQVKTQDFFLVFFCFGRGAEHPFFRPDTWYFMCFVHMYVRKCGEFRETERREGKGEVWGR